MTQELKVMVGIPGCGKSTWANRETQFLEEEKATTAIISRDEIRKSFVGEANPNNSNSYFGREDEVFEEFIRQINEAMEIGIDYVFVDATHISRASRAKLLSRLRPDPNTVLTFEVMDCGLDTCLARNATRTGFARVPDSAIKNMKKGYRPPTMEEFSNYLYGFKKVTINHHNTEKE